MRNRFLLALLSSFLLVGHVSAGPITVFTEIYSAGGTNTGQIPVSGLGEWAVLTSFSVPGPTVTVPANQTTASQAVVGLAPVMEFSNLAQYQFQRPTVVTVPPTQVQLYVEVWDGAYGGAGVPFKQLFLDGTVSAQVSPTPGLNTVNWQFTTVPAQVTFADGTVVSVNYQAVVMPAGVPAIQFQDGTPPIGAGPGSIYYPTLVDANVTVSSSTAATPEPSSAVLLAGLTLGGLVARRSRREPMSKS